MVFITGDCHGAMNRFSSDIFKCGKDLTKDDYVIICGDFGLIWSKEEDKTEKYWLDWLNNKPWTTLFVDGNHENFNRLESYPVETWCGGHIHKIRDSVYHLMRGQIFEISGKTYFTLGGARSHDISDGVFDRSVPEDATKIRRLAMNPFAMFRILNESWWPQEVPNANELNEAIANLAAHGNKVDYIITHQPPIGVAAMLLGGTPGHKDDADEAAFFDTLNYIANNVNYERWFSGHLHRNERFDRDFVLYKEIIPAEIFVFDDII